jgi:hypothetical protein
LTSYVQEMAFGDEDPGVILDRYHTPDFEWYNDGHRLDRENLIPLLPGEPLLLPADPLTALVALKASGFAWRATWSGA